MRCKPCGAHFCYLCGDGVNAEHPYKHWNIQGIVCYQRLFEMAEGDGEEGEERRRMQLMQEMAGG
jgi:hypothetical protein